MDASSIVGDISGLFPPQSDLLAQGYLESDKNWLICAPTGAGKTLMSEWVMLKAIHSGRKAAYVAPLKAIVEERVNEWESKFPDFHLGLYTGDSTKKAGDSPKDENLLLFTPEKLAGYVHRWKKNLPWIAQLDVIVFDEFHLLGELSRGPCLEALIGRLRRINPFVRIISLSATLSNYEELAEWLNAEVFVSDWRPVPIERRVVRFKKPAQKFELLLREVIATRDQGGKTLIFVNSRKRSEAIAQKLKEIEISADHNHAGLDRERRNSTTSAMKLGLLDALVSTSTLEMGVNFPARKVVIYDSYGFNGESFSLLTVQRYLQCSGRAGRPGFDDHGESVIFLPIRDRSGVDYLSGQPEPVRSGLFATEALAKEIVNEVSSRLSISERHLDSNFGGFTLWR